MEEVNDISLASTIKDQIANFYRVHSEDCYSSKMVASYLDLKINTVRTYIQQLQNEGYLERIQKGIYQWNGRLTPKQIKSILAEHQPTFHGQQYIIKGGKGSQLIFSQNPHKEKKTFEKIGLDNTLRQCTWHKQNDTIQLSIDSTDNPLTPLEQVTFGAWLIEQFPKSEIYLTNIGINRDLPIKLEGIQCVTIQEFNNVLYRAYNKGKSLRIEHHYSSSVNLIDVLKIESEFFKYLLKTQNKQRPILKVKA